MAGLAGSTVTTVKLVLLGNGSAGKTSLCARFVEDGFTKQYRQTIGCDFYDKQVELRTNKTVSLQVWDIGGQSITSKMIGNYVYGSHVVFLCYDVTDASSFYSCDDWLANVHRTYAAQKTSDVPGEVKKPPSVYLVALKIDLIGQRVVTPEAHERFVQENGLDGGYFVSASTGENVLIAVYSSAARAAGITLTQDELAFYQQVLQVRVQAEREEEADGHHDNAPHALHGDEDEDGRPSGCMPCFGGGGRGGSSRRREQR
mmetsp:Transcript_16378/g.42434  ORF Transcript_16378/g.42434 Transcript_16378/m.42434 type:complete len:259 (-) Transcript_16378:290-1066(-)